MNILVIDSSILGANSVSRRLTASALGHLAAAYPQAVVVRRDLDAEPVPHLSSVHLGASDANGGELQAQLDQSAAVLREFLEADVVILGVGFYNFGIPSQLKAWIDRICVARVTFQYRLDGSVEGLMSGKQIIICIARGGYYSSPTVAQLEHGESYLRTVMQFLGANVNVIAADGLSVGPEQREAGIAQAERSISALLQSAPTWDRPCA